MASFFGSPGNDIFTGGVDPDTASGGGGNDSLSGADEGDYLAGGAGSDTVDGGAGDDWLYSGAFSVNTSLPYAGNNFTLPDADTGAEVDTLLGGEGSDRFFVGYGDNVDGGGNGYWNDYLYISLMGAPQGVTVDFRAPTLTIGGGLITGVENLTSVQGSAFADNLYVETNYRSGYSQFTAVSGMGGNDTLTAGYYVGSLFGDEGDDVLDGRASEFLDVVRGGSGNDTLYMPSKGFGTADGGDGHDTILGYGTTHGGAGNDTITMQDTSYFAQAYGDDGDDIITAGTYYSDWHTNPIAGGSGSDTLTGTARGESLFTGDLLDVGGPFGYGFGGADDLGVERDRINAGDGADILASGWGDDVDGGAGSDTLRLTLAGAGRGVEFDTARAAVGESFSVGEGVVRNVENLVYLRGTDFADTLTIRTQNVRMTVEAGGGDDVISTASSSSDVNGGAGNDRFVSGAAADGLNGGDGVDTVDYGAYASAVSVDLQAGYGGGGDGLISIEGVLGSTFGDTLGGSTANNTLLGGAGDDVITEVGGSNFLRGNEGSDRLSGGSGFDDLHGNTGDDTLQGADGDDWVVGGQDNDLLRGDGGSDIVWGNLGADTCEGGDGLDLVRGGQADDVLNGGAGGDYLSGDRGTDTVTGGSGADFFHTFADAGIDRVTDFNVAQGDRVMLDPGTAYVLRQVGGDAVIDMGGGNQMILEGVQASTLQGGAIFESWIVPW